MIYGLTKGRGGGIGNVAEVMTMKKAPVVLGWSFGSGFDLMAWALFGIVE